MSRKILMIRHMEPQRNDRVSEYLAAQGWDLHWCFPAVGDTLPTTEEIHAHFSAAVVFGGSQSVNDGEKSYLRTEIKWIETWLSTGKPFFGICLGAQLLARTLGATVSRHPQGLHEVGYVEVTPTHYAQPFMSKPTKVFQWHDEGFALPHGATPLAHGETFTQQAYQYGDHVYAVQFHPEVTPIIMQSWIKEASHSLSEPGAHSAKRLCQDAIQYDVGMQNWLNAFMSHWQRSWVRQDTAVQV